MTSQTRSVPGPSFPNPSFSREPTNCQKHQRSNAYLHSCFGRRGSDDGSQACSVAMQDKQQARRASRVSGVRRELGSRLSQHSELLGRVRGTAAQRRHRINPAAENREQASIMNRECVPAEVSHIQDHCIAILRHAIQIPLREKKGILQGFPFLTSKTPGIVQLFVSSSALPAGLIITVETSPLCSRQILGLGFSG
jgi:hypothetical protein